MENLLSTAYNSTDRKCSPLKLSLEFLSIFCYEDTLLGDTDVNSLLLKSNLETTTILSFYIPLS